MLPLQLIASKKSSASRSHSSGNVGDRRRGCSGSFPANDEEEEEEDEDNNEDEDCNKDEDDEDEDEEEEDCNKEENELNNSMKGDTM